jgi:hypothetical protein
MNGETAQLCVYCGAVLFDAKEREGTHSFDDTNYEDGDPRWGSARFGNRTNLLIGVEDDPRTFIFDADQVDELVLGRMDPASGEAPVINLTEHGGVKKGVSRRHAKIIRKSGSLYLVDMNSANGTFLNGQQLVAEQSRILRDGDAIRLAHLRLRVTFEKVKPKTI